MRNTGGAFGAHACDCYSFFRSADQTVEAVAGQAAGGCGVWCVLGHTKHC